MHEKNVHRLDFAKLKKSVKLFLLIYLFARKAVIFFFNSSFFENFKIFCVVDTKKDNYYFSFIAHYNLDEGQFYIHV